ncbi:MAG TPA: anti-sigma factor antagonist, partial [Planctomycetota bacterium]|nr:anti-sigma factor antagonist [Planctomycetota bacterium]
EGRVTFASAGHNPVCVWTPLAGRCEEISAPGIALGVAPPDVFGKKTEEESFLLPPDGRLLIYTDGLTEAMNPANEQYGEDRMKEAMEGAAGAGSEEFVSRLMESVDGHRKDAAPWDDITLVALRRLPLPRPAPPPAGYNQKSHGEGLADASEPPGEDSKLKKGILSVKLEQRPGLAGLLKVSGSIDAHTFSDFQEGFQRLEAAGHRWVIVDLTHLEYISSVGLNYFVNRRVDLIQKDGDVVLVNPQPAIAKILKMLGLYEVLRVVGTLQEAWALAAPGPAESA